MAVTIAHVKSNSAGGFYEHLVDITGPASYTTGGEALSAGQVTSLMPKLGGALATTDLAKCQYFTSERSAAGVQVTLDRANAKMVFLAAGAEAGSGSNQSAAPVRALLRYGCVSD